MDGYTPDQWAETPAGSIDGRMARGNVALVLMLVPIDQPLPCPPPGTQWAMCEISAELLQPGPVSPGLLADAGRKLGQKIERMRLARFVR